ncbi:hypothetical protein [Tenacibaculum sp. nBUS_03]|uniref:hypothetical protein n=1 Tax=Tenacibaculum sp. nBUS_03 TaxID=3395320 RepID=UPI003EBE40A4
MFDSVDIKEKLFKIRDKDITNKNLSKWIEEIFDDLADKRSTIHNNLLEEGERNTNCFNITKLDFNAVFHINQIRKICIDYRLRFLGTSLFKGDYPPEAISKIRALELKHNTSIKGFKIVAPYHLFKIKKADDPILFAPMGNDYYYLIHKWGNDMHPLRKTKYWPVKSVLNLGLTITVLSVLITIFSYNFNFDGKQGSISYLIVIFLFTFKSMIGVILFYGVASGKNFSEYCWQSKYDKIS